MAGSRYSGKGLQALSAPDNTSRSRRPSWNLRKQKLRSVLTAAALLLAGGMLCMVIVLPATAAAEAADAAAKKRAEQNLKRTLENIKNLMLGMVGVVAAICLIYVGFLYMKAGDTPEARLNAKRHLQSVLFGLLICLLASTIVSVVSGCVVGS